MKLLLLIASLLSLSAFGQEDEVDPKYIDIKWKVGTIRNVTQHDTVTTFSNDTLLVASGITTNYKIKVAALQDTVYEILFKQVTLNSGLNTASEVEGLEQKVGILSELLLGLQDKMKEFEYSLLVDKNTGQAFKIKNEEEYADFTQEIVLLVFNNLITKFKLPVTLEEKNEILKMCKERMTEQIPLMMETTINSFNFIFQAYQYPYTNGETIEFETQVGDVQATEGEEQLIDAVCEVRGIETGKELNMDYKYTYDKNQAYDLHIVKEGIAAEVPKDQFDLNQSTTVRIDLTNGWIKKSTANIYQRLGPIRYYQTSTVTMR